MIKFFRQIRKRLLTENRFSKYLLYAIGEIVLVVIGILIALQINNSNENRKNHKQELLLLNQLLVDFEDNLKQLDQKINIRNEITHSCKHLFKLIENPHLRNKDSVDMHLAKTMPYATFDPILVDLASSGELNFIKNIGLKKALTRWTSEINDVIEDEVIWKDYRNNYYIPTIVKHYQLRSIRNKAYKANMLSNYSMERDKATTEYINNEIGFSYYKTDYNLLLNTPDFEDHITRCYAINNWANIQSRILRKRIIEIIAMIESEIKNSSK